MEHAVLLDARGDYGHFQEPLQRARLSLLAAHYLWVEDGIFRTRGPDDAIAFLEEKARVFSHLPIAPLLLMQRLVERYQVKGDTEHARELLRAITRFEYPAGEVETLVHQWAHSQLREMPPE